VEHRRVYKIRGRGIRKNKLGGHSKSPKNGAFDIHRERRRRKLHVRMMFLEVAGG